MLENLFFDILGNFIANILWQLLLAAWHAHKVA